MIETLSLESGKGKKKSLTRKNRSANKRVSQVIMACESSFSIEFFAGIAQW